MEALRGAMGTDTRGWIMTAISGAACVLGSSVICIDLLLNRFERWKDFRIQDSGYFLAVSMSFSFGVMIFSSLYSMLPSAKSYLQKGDVGPNKAAWILVGLFIGGFVGIQIISRFLHHYMPSHVVDCDHSHEESSHRPTNEHSRAHSHVSHHSHHHGSTGRHSHNARKSLPAKFGEGANESTPLLNGTSQADGPVTASEPPQQPSRPSLTAGPYRDGRRSSMVQVHARVMSFVRDTGTNCDGQGSCYGYGEPCGEECLKNFPVTRQNSLWRPHAFLTRHPVTFHAPDLEHAHGSRSDVQRARSHAGAFRSSRAASRGNSEACQSSSRSHSPCSLSSSSSSEELKDVEAQHHHHVPENAFMSIGLQTSIAIALHKLPEGFITYATNHASPSLGFSVFMALFIHNITEGFAMALPLYLALQSRPRAILWSSLLGGISQPAGAGVAALWFWIAGRTGDGDSGGPGYAVYGGMFAVTAGIMTSVALQLFVEGLGMAHRKDVCVASAMCGMALLGVSQALTA